MTEAFSTICAVYIEDYEGCGCPAVMAEHWWLKSEVFWVRLPVTAGYFTSLYYLSHITSQFPYKPMDTFGLLSQFKWVRIYTKIAIILGRVRM